MGNVVLVLLLVACIAICLVPVVARGGSSQCVCVTAAVGLGVCVCVSAAEANSVCVCAAVVADVCVRNSGGVAAEEPGERREGEPVVGYPPVDEEAAEHA